jgi:hypothetical protein
MRWPTSFKSRRLAEALAPLGETPEDMKARAAQQPPLDIWPVYESPRLGARSPYGDDSDQAIETMSAELAAAGPGSTTEALALLRHIFPRYPLTLRLAAVVAYMKAHPVANAAFEPPQ